MKPEYCTPVKLAVFCLVALLAACGVEEPAGDPMEAGQERWLRYCASCHGAEGEGRPPSFPPVAGSEWLELPSEALALIVLRGLRGEIEVKGEKYRGFMPPMRHMSDEDIALSVAWMEETWGDREATLQARDIAELRDRVMGDRQPMEGLDGVTSALEQLENQGPETNRP